MDLALTAAEHDPARRRGRSGRGRAPRRRLWWERPRRDRSLEWESAHGGNGLVPIEPAAPGVDSQGGDSLELLEAHVFEALAWLFRHCSPYFFAISHFGRTGPQIVWIWRVRSTASVLENPKLPSRHLPLASNDLAWHNG